LPPPVFPVTKRPGRVGAGALGHGPGRAGLVPGQKTSPLWPATIACCAVPCTMLKMLLCRCASSHVHPACCARRALPTSVTLIRVGPPGCFTHVSITRTTPIFSALKNYCT
jgi:hypothetical protein